MTATVISFSNFKGGVGKTSTTALVSYELSKKGYKVLDIDFDAQANLTSLLLKTKANDENIITIDKSLMTAINENIPLKDITININNNLDMIPNAVDFSMYPRYLDRTFSNEDAKVSYLKGLIEPLKDEYDMIFIDVPPTMSLQNDTAYYACDQIIVVLQTQERSLAGAEVFIQYLQNVLIDEFKSPVDVLGILPVLSKRNAAVDKEILDSAKEEYGDGVFESKIMQMERIKRMDMTGITDNSKDVWDNKVHDVFTKTADEMLRRLNIEK